jgi:hypothetical protein
METSDLVGECAVKKVDLARTESELSSLMKSEVNIWNFA